MSTTNSSGVATGFTEKLKAFVDHPWLTYFITTIILINAVTLGLETDADLVAEYGGLLSWIDQTILIMFTIELALKMIAYRHRFFLSPWNIFDFVIVGISWLPATGALSVLRALRVLRILRLLSVVPQLNRVISAIGHSIPGMVSVIGVLGLIFYVSSVLATKLFGQHPDANMQEWFGSVSASAYSLFQIMTLESWSMGIVRPTMKIFPQSWIFFVPFIIITSFAVLNLFIGIIVDAMQSSRDEDKSELKEFADHEVETLHAKFDILETELKEIKALIKEKSS